MKLGAERKKVVALVSLVAVAGIVYWMNSGSDAPPTPSSPRPAADATAAPPTDGTRKVAARRNASGHPKIDEFNPKVGEPVDPSKVDPTLHLEWLTKVQSIELDQGNHRNVFKIETPPPEQPLVAANGKGPIPDVGPIHPNGPTPPVTPADTNPKPGPPAVASAPPINLKYYGYATKRTDGEKKAFFLDGDEVIVATEGEIIKKQYKVVRIGTNSVQMEDTASKSTQTLPLQEVAPA